ncbi:hypothetical protein [Sinorhizobium arboris]|uniref:hypothetical protein n=1 Tax=Sinorhizobium arboris TaxID=76745 RepID=UPI0004019479|nr:hypothetical protein [Sinorhizobium arboris]
MNSAEDILRRFGYFADSVVEKMLLQLCPGGNYEITMEISTIDDFKDYARKKIALTFDGVSEFRLFESRTQIFSLGLGISYARLGEEHLFDLYDSEAIAVEEIQRSNFYIRARGLAFAFID